MYVYSGYCRVHCVEHRSTSPEHIAISNVCFMHVGVELNQTEMLRLMSGRRTVKISRNLRFFHRELYQKSYTYVPTSCTQKIIMGTHDLQCIHGSD